MSMRILLLSSVLFVLCFPSIFYAQMNSWDKYKMQTQGNQFKDKLKADSQNTMSQAQEVVQENKVDAVKYQADLQNTMFQAQEVVQENKVGAAKYQEDQRETIEIFGKIAEKNEKPDMIGMLSVYIVPIAIIAVTSVIFIIVWHQSI